jgi:hypothetical protein
MDWVDNKKHKLFSKSWIRKPILDIYKCPKVKSWLKNGTKTSFFHGSEHYALIL